MKKKNWMKSIESNQTWWKLSEWKMKKIDEHNKNTKKEEEVDVEGKNRHS